MKIYQLVFLISIVMSQTMSQKTISQRLTQLKKLDEKKTKRIEKLTKKIDSLNQDFEDLKNSHLNLGEIEDKLMKIGFKINLVSEKIVKMESNLAGLKTMVVKNAAQISRKAEKEEVQNLSWNEEEHERQKVEQYAKNYRYSLGM